MSSKCPKCGNKIKATYLKQNCPYCNVNMLYYKLDEQLETDAENAQREIDAVNKFVDIIKASTIKTPLHIIRLLLFFTPLISMCLPMYWAGYKNVSLITFIMSIINHGLDFGALTNDKSYFFAVLSMIFVILLSLAVIISSLFSATKRGFRRNIILSGINSLALLLSGMACCLYGGYVKVGFTVTCVIYALEFLLHYLCANTKNKKRKLISFTAAVSWVMVGVIMLLIPLGGKMMLIENVDDFKPEESKRSVVSFNVASAFGTSLEDTDSMVRCRRFGDYMQKVHPDFIGTQEMNEYWMTALETGMSDYNGYGVIRGGDSEKKNSEMNSVFWLKDKYTSLDVKTIWLSETPEQESKYTYIDSDGNEAQAGCNRVCSYAILRDKNTSDTFAMMNTHLDNASEEARLFGANVVLEEIEKIKKEYPDITIILTGDFNEDENASAVKMLSESLNICKDDTKESVATYQEWGYRNTGDMPIDFIFSSRDCTKYTVLDDISGGYVSDHYGIYGVIG